VVKQRDGTRNWTQIVIFGRWEVRLRNGGRWMAGIRLLVR
jgi:hypothetical protein